MVHAAQIRRVPHAAHANVHNLNKMPALVPSNVRRRSEKELDLLLAIDDDAPLTQRAMAQRLGVALGLTNLYLKRLARKGYIKIVEFPRKPAAGKRFRYLLTPKGITEKSRLTYDHLAYYLNLYRRARQTLRESLGQLSDKGLKRVVLFGTGEAAELAYITLKEFSLEPVGVCSSEPNGHFLGLPVRGIAELSPEEFEGIVIATFDRPEPFMAELHALGIPPEKILTLRRPAPPGEDRARPGTARAGGRR